MTYYWNKRNSDKNYSQSIVSNKCNRNCYYSMRGSKAYWDLVDDDRNLVIGSFCSNCKEKEIILFPEYKNLPVKEDF
jgi:hypothetical protein